MEILHTSGSCSSSSRWQYKAHFKSTRPPPPQGCRNYHNSTTTMTKGNNLISMCPKKRQMQVAASRSRPVYCGEDSFHTRAHICFSTLVKSTQTGPFDRPLLAQVMSSTSFYAPLALLLAPTPPPCLFYMLTLSL